jgi:3-phenylpropionate/trans-cinnamate dioxygenase ferredoxin reductase component
VTDSRHIVLAGAGQCSASAAAALRSRGFDGRITMIGAEPHLPYERPPLSKDYLTGKATDAELAIHDADSYASSQIDVLPGTSVTGIDAAARTLRLSSGDTAGYDLLLIATGGRPRTLPGLVSDRILYLRSRDDAARLAGLLHAGQSLLIMGGGFIGCEVAASARSLGTDVTVLEMQEMPLQAVLGARVGGMLADLHRGAGVTLRTGERVQSVTEHAGGLAVRTDRGVLECDQLLVATGIVPNTEFLAGSGVTCDNGVEVDEYCRTSVPGIFAAGDVASHHHPVFGEGIRVEHYDNAIKQGTAAAASMLGDGAPYADLHWFWSDQYEHNLQSVGITQGCDEVIVRGSGDDLSWSAFYLAGGVVRSVFAFNRPKDVTIGRRMVAAQLRPGPDQLRDESFDLRSLVRPPRRTP